MNWLSVLIIFWLLYTASQIIQKSIIDRLPMAKSLSFQFLFCALIMAGFILIFGKLQFQLSLLLISGVGLINAWGAYMQWRAFGYSLSKTVVFLALPGLVTVSLAAVFLGEKSIYNFQIISGTILLFSSAFLLSKRSDSEKRKDTNFRWLFFVVGMVLIQGFTVFMTKYFSVSDISRSTFLFYWYSGSFLGSLPILLVERSNKYSLFQKGSWRIPLAALAMLGSMATVYWAFQLAPAGIIEPMRRVGMISFPMLAGWFIFKEREGLSKIQILGFLLGIIGALLTISGAY